MGWWTDLNNWIDDQITTPSEAYDEFKDDAAAAAAAVQKAIFNFLMFVVFVAIIAFMLYKNL